MKTFCLFIFLLCFTALFSQEKEKPAKTVVIKQQKDSIFFNETELLIESLDYGFDSCRSCGNRFITTIEIRNKTNTKIVCPSHFVTWNDAPYLRDYNQVITLEPNGKGIITIESNVCNRRKMTSTRTLKIITANGDVVELPMTLKYVCGKVVCKP